MSSSDYERGYAAGYRAGIRKFTKVASPPKASVLLTVKKQAYAACQAGVDECHRIEQEEGLPMWAEGISQEQWSKEYVAARTNWDKLREERNRVYQS